MKATRKLIPAIAMLLISAVMMSTASFAWFSTNTRATADGLNIQIAAATTLLIKEKGSDKAYNTGVTLTDTETRGAVDPVSAVPSATPNFWQLDSAGTKMDPDNAAYGSDSTFKKAETANYIVKTVQLRATGDLTNNDIKVSMNVAATESPMDPALRIMLVYGDKYFYFAPMANADTDAKPIENYADSKVTEYAEEIDYSNTTGEFIIENIVVDTEYEVTIYVWYEGQDAACKATNAIKISDLAPIITFELSNKA